MNAIKKLLGSPKKIMKKIIAGIVITAGAIFGVNHLHQGGVGHSNRENLAGVMAEGTKLETVDGKYVGGGNSNRENLAGATSEELLAPKPNRENLAGATSEELGKAIAEQSILELLRNQQQRQDLRINNPGSPLNSPEY